MAHTITYHEDLGVLEMRVHGELHSAEVEEIVPKILQKVKEHDCYLILSDYRDATMNLSVTEIYEVPQRIVEVFSGSGIRASQVKRALVVAKDLEDFRFFETVTLNRAQNAKLFQDYEEAKQWLLEK